MERIKAVLLLTVIVVAFGLYTAWGMRPFAGLRAEWIDGAEILPGIPVEGTEELMQGVLVNDTEKLALLLRISSRGSRRILQRMTVMAFRRAFF